LLIGSGKVHLESSGIAIKLLLQWLIAFCKDPSGVYDLALPYEMTPFPLPIKTSVL
jgi:hypothetical protein